LYRLLLLAAVSVSGGGKAKSFSVPSLVVILDYKKQQLGAISHYYAQSCHPQRHGEGVQG
jgi:hypothetical protein